MIISNINAGELVKATATPALFARTVSQGRWRLSRHLLLLDRKLTDLAARRIKRLIVTMPPRHGKSELCSKYFLAWHLGVFPEQRVILASYEHSFAAKWGREVRNLIQEHGPSLFGVSVSDDTAAKDRWELAGHKGGMRTAGIGGPILGEGADVLCIDDPLKNAEEAMSQTIRDKHWDWWQSTATSRLEPDAAILVTMQRWHDDDLVGRILTQARETGEAWDVVNMPAVAEGDEVVDGQLFRRAGDTLWPERWGAAWYAAREKTVDRYWWLAQYQQRPGRFGRSEWPDEYFGPHLWADEWPTSLAEFSARYIALDPSKGKDARKGDYGAFVFVGLRGGKFWIDAKIERMPVSRLIDAGLQLAGRYQPHGFGVEANQFQELLANEFLREQQARNAPPLPLFTITNTVNKELRIQRLGPLLMNRMLVFRDTPDCRLLVSQLRDFPLGQHDDGPDALEMAIRLLSETSGVDTTERILGRVA